MTVGINTTRYNIATTGCEFVGTSDVRGAAGNSAVPKRFLACSMHDESPDDYSLSIALRLYLYIDHDQTTYVERIMQITCTFSRSGISPVPRIARTISKRT